MDAFSFKPAEVDGELSCFDLELREHGKFTFISLFCEKLFAKSS